MANRLIVKYPISLCAITHHVTCLCWTQRPSLLVATLGRADSLGLNLAVCVRDLLRLGLDLTAGLAGDVCAGLGDNGGLVSRADGAVCD